MAEAKNASPVNEFDYEAAGFDSFLRRAIDTSPAVNLDDNVGPASRQFNFDQAQVSGALGNSLKIGSISLDGVAGRITISDDSGNTVVLLGELGD